LDIYRTNYRPIDCISPTQEKQISGELITRLQKILGDELNRMAMYLQATYSIPKNAYSVDYFGYSKDMQHQLICHAIHEMRHAETIGRILCKIGHNPRLKTSRLTPPKTYKEMLTMIFESEQDGIKNLSEALDATNDQEIKVTLLNQIREENAHLQMRTQIYDQIEKTGLIDTVLPSPEGAGPVSYDINILLDAFELEIQSIITLIYGSILLGMDMAIPPRLRALSIEDMQHLNKIAQDIITLGGRPVVSPESLNNVPRLSNAVQVIDHAIEIKQQKIRQYDQFSQMIKSKGAAKTLSDMMGKEEENISDLKGFANSLQTAEPIH